MFAKKLSRLIKLLDKKLNDAQNGYIIETLERDISELKRIRKDKEQLFILRPENDRADLKNEIEAINDKIALLDKRLDLFNKGKQDILNDISDIRQTPDALKQFTPKDSYTREEIISDIAKIIAMPGGYVTLIFKTEQKMHEMGDKCQDLQAALGA